MAKTIRRRHIWKAEEDAALLRIDATGAVLKDIVKEFNEETKLDLSRASIQHRLARLKSGTASAPR